MVTSDTVLVFPLDQSSVAGVPVCPALGRAGRAELDLGAIPLHVKPAVATLVCAGTHMLYGPICLLPTNSWLSEKNKLVIGLSPIKLLHIRQGSSSCDSSPPCIQAEELGGLTTFSSALLAHLRRRRSLPSLLFCFPGTLAPICFLATIITVITDTYLVITKCLEPHEIHCLCYLTFSPKPKYFFKSPA